LPLSQLDPRTKLRRECGAQGVILAWQHTNVEPGARLCRNNVGLAASVQHRRRGRVAQGRADEFAREPECGEVAVQGLRGEREPAGRTESREEAFERRAAHDRKTVRADTADRASQCDDRVVGGRA